MKRKKRMKKIEDSLRGQWGIIQQTVIYLWEFQKEKRENNRRTFEERMTDCVLNLVKDMNLQIQELNELRVR